MACSTTVLQSLAHLILTLRNCIYDLDLFSLNTGIDTLINPDSNILNQHIRSLYYSLNSFYNHKCSLHSSHCKNGGFSIFHNIRSLKRNLESLQTHLLSELDFQFSIIALTETRITNLKEIDFNPNISGYVFEYVPTPLSAGGVGIYINENLDYTVVERTSNPAFQALWIEILVPNKRNVICGVLYRQHNSPESFLSYFNETVERFNACDKTVYIAGDFNIHLLKSESCNYAHNCLLSLQSYSFIPLKDKLTRVYGNSATLIDNILVNNTTNLLSCGNIISDISDHFSQLCVMSNNLMKRSVNGF